MNYACRLNGIDTIALTKLDVLGNGEPIQVCTNYKLDGKTIDTFPANADDVERLEPVYEELPGFAEDISGCRTFAELPEAAQQYVRYVESKTGVRVGYIGVGPDREQTIICGE